jgi:hypothetical protein
MKKIVIALVFFLNAYLLSAQFGISAGTTFIKPFGLKGIFPGFHIGGEYVNDEHSTLFARIAFSPSKQGITYDNLAYTVGKNGFVNPYSFSLESTERMNFTTIEAGKRYYFGNGYDNGFSFYGGSMINLTFNKVKYDIEEFDEDKYDLYLGAEKFRKEELMGNIFSLAFGLNAGIKNSFYFGTLYFDIGMNYAIFAMPSNEIASTSSQYRNLYFNFNLGFRKDFY